MEPTDLTVRLLQEIRDDARENAKRSDERAARLEETMLDRFEQVDSRFEVLETSLRDMAQQLVMLESRVEVLEK